MIRQPIADVFADAVVRELVSLGAASPMLAGGSHAAQFVPLARALGFTGLEWCAEHYGRAAATKMCRSVLIKGMEALLAEALLAARHYGVEDEVLASLGDLLPRPDWNEHARYMIARSVEHGVRRAEEMLEAARTVAEAGLDPLMCTACVERQQWAAQFDAALAHSRLEPMLDEQGNLLPSLTTPRRSGPPGRQEG